MKALPAQVNASWIATLGDKQLMEAEAALHAIFSKEELAEKKRAGARYQMMRGPESLMSAWQRWLLVNNEVRARNVPIHRKARKAQAQSG